MTVKRSAVESLLKTIDCDPSGVALVMCPDLGRREWLVELVESLIADGAKATRVAGVEEALAETLRTVLLIPKDERKVVQDLDASCDRLLEPVRSRPIVLFLMRDGDGARTMASEAPSLWSWIGGRVSDPEMRAEIDVPRQRAAFEARHGSSPEAWLAWWRSGSLPKTAANFHTAHEAVFLEESK